MSNTPDNPNESASPTEGDDQDIDPIGGEQLELGEIEQWLEALKEES